MFTLNTTVYMNPLEQFEIKELFYFFLLPGLIKIISYLVKGLNSILRD